MSPAFLMPARSSFPSFPSCGHQCLPGHAKPYIPPHVREPGNLLFARPAAADTTAGTGGVPRVDGLLAPPSGAAHEHVRLGELVAGESAFGDAETLRNVRQAEIPAGHCLRPAASPNPPAASPKTPAGIGFQKARARLHAPSASATHPSVLNPFMLVPLWSSLEDRGSGFLG